MKLKNLLLIAVSLLYSLSGIARSNAPELIDDDGMPVFYLRGSEIGHNWSAETDYKFTREGNTYTLNVEFLSGRFKIGTSDWTINYGGNFDITASQMVIGKIDGANFRVPEPLYDVAFTFDYIENSSTAEIYITVGDKPIPPVPGISGTLPVLYINVYDEFGNYNNEVIDKDLAHKNYFSGNYWLDLNGCEWLAEEGAKSIGSEEEPLPLEIKARGNFTRTGFSKKPFKLKLGSKQKLLGLSKSKHFALLAHADDNKGFLRNFIGFNLGKRIGLPWTPSQQPVEVVINGDYRGLYFLTESIRVEEDRIGITELKDNVDDPDLCSGGYLVELDNYNEDNQIQMMEKTFVGGYTDMLRVTFDTPEEYSELQRRFVTQQFSTMNDFVGSNSDDLWTYMDLDDAVRYYIVEEMISHVEAYHGSTYLFRDRGENQKWHFSPLWDCGNAFNGPENDFFYRHAPYGCTWIASIRENNKFNDCLRKTWLWFISSKLNGIEEDTKDYISRISSAVATDHARWKDAPVPEGGLHNADNSSINSRHADTMRHFNNKLAWLKNQFGDCGELIYDEPERDLTPAAPLPEFVNSSLTEVSADFSEEVEYYNLQGIRVTNPAPGNIYIQKNATGASKIKIR